MCQPNSCWIIILVTIFTIFPLVYTGLEGGEHSYQGRFLLGDHLEAIKQVSEALQDDLKYQITLKLLAFSTVLPAVRKSTLNESSQLLALLETRKDFFRMIANNQIYSMIIRTWDLTRLVYETTSGLLFAETDVLKNWTGGGEGETDVIAADGGFLEITTPLLGFVREIITKWPHDSELFLLFSGVEFVEKLILLLWSPVWEEQKMTGDTITDTIYRLADLENSFSIDSYAKVVLNQIGLLLTETNRVKSGHLVNLYRDIINCSSKAIAIEFIQDWLIRVFENSHCQSSYNKVVEDIYSSIRILAPQKIENVIQKLFDSMLKVNLVEGEKAQLSLLFRWLYEGLVPQNFQPRFFSLLFLNAEHTKNTETKGIIIDYLSDPRISKLFDGAQIEPAYRVKVHVFYRNLICWLHATPKYAQFSSKLEGLWENSKSWPSYSIILQDDPNMLCNYETWLLDLVSQLNKK